MKTDSFDTRLNHCLEEIDAISQQINNADEEDKIAHKMSLMAAYKETGALFFTFEKYDKAKDYYLRFFSLMEEIKSKDSNAEFDSIVKECRNLSDCFLKAGDDKTAIQFLCKAIETAEKRVFNNPANQPGGIDPDDIVARTESERYEDDCSLLLTLYERVIGHYADFKHPDQLAAPWIDKAIVLCETLVARNPKRFELEPVKIYFGAATMLINPKVKEARRFYYKTCIDKIRNLKYTDPEEYEPLLAISCFRVATTSSKDDTENLQELLDEAVMLAEKYKETNELYREIADFLS